MSAPPLPLAALSRLRCNELIYRNLRTGQIVSIVNASLLAWVANTIAPEAIASVPLLSWWLLALLVAAARIGTAYRYAQQAPTVRASAADNWRRLALLGAAGSGLLWSAGSWLLMQTDNTLLQLFTGFVMAGMVAGAVPALAADRHVFRAYAWPVVGTVALCAWGQDPLHLAFFTMAVIFLLVATRSADNFHQALHDAIRLEQEKDALVSHLKQAQAIAEQSNRTKTEFLANISHELRTPMNGILGTAELLTMEPLTSEQQELVDLLQHSAELMNRHINHLILLSALEAGKVSIEQLPFNIADMVQRLSTRYRPQATARGLELLVEITPPLPETLYGDINRLSQVLEHLLDNAIRFTEQGSVRIGARPLTQDDALVCIEFRVADTGVGMAPALLEELQASLMLQADGSSVRRHGGIGIGLSLARKLIQLLGGDLQIESAPGQGSDFRFTLPFPKQKASEQTAGTGLTQRP